MSFYKVIKEICAQEGINMRQLSDRTGIAYTTIRNFATKDKGPSHKTLMRIINTPGLEKYRTALLGDDNAVDAEIMRLIQELTERGQEQQVLALLKEFQSEEQSSDPADDDAQQE